MNAHAGSPLVINPGAPQTVCKGDSVTLGGHPCVTGGSGPSVITWAPSAGMNNAHDSNPHVKVNATTTYTITVVDSAGNRKIDSVTITIDGVANTSAGSDATICMYFDSTTVGSASNNAAYIYSWSPTTGLTCPTCPVTTAKPTATTTYRLVAHDPVKNCWDTTYVTVTVAPPPTLSTNSPVIIHRGESGNISVTGLTSAIQWYPTTSLNNPNIANPTATPLVTTTYTVIGKDASGCFGVDSVVVDVINDSALIFYNTFTPNGDGINDTWYIGNIDLFPQNEVLIFNRYGEQIYRANDYQNQWDGTFGGNPVPDATYYYIVYTGTGKTYKGSVTIIRKSQ